ncbi:MAG: DUF5119 domain-containing protein, partial [Paramuribaculum sp.]|nr:DUF5119 domain-containing protein [Paramuribaculum sp.]
SNWDVSYHGFAYNDLRPATPEWVNLVKYRDSNPDGEHYLEAEGGEIMLQEKGDYSFLFYNGDTEYIELSDVTSLNDARASATPRSRASLASVMERHPGARSASSPDMLYSACLENIQGIDFHEVKHLPVKMRPLVYTYVVRFDFEYGADHIALARGALGGMAESVYLRDGHTSDESVIVLFECEVTENGCEAHVRSFGVPGITDEYYGNTQAKTADRPYTLNLEVLLTNGTTLQFNYDIAEQIKKQPKGGVLKVSGIRIEDEQNKHEMGSGDFDVDLSDWGLVDIDFPLPDYNDTDNSSEK